MSGNNYNPYPGNYNQQPHSSLPNTENQHEASPSSPPPYAPAAMSAPPVAVYCNPTNGEKGPLNAPQIPVNYAPNAQAYVQPQLVVQPMYILPSNAVVFGTQPVRCQCCFCNQIQTTKVERYVGCNAWLISGLICLLGGVFGCCLIPFCMDTCKDSSHSCSSCGAKLGTFSH